MSLQGISRDLKGGDQSVVGLQTNLVETPRGETESKKIPNLDLKHPRSPPASSDSDLTPKRPNLLQNNPYSQESWVGFEPQKMVQDEENLEQPEQIFEENQEDGESWEHWAERVGGDINKLYVRTDTLAQSLHEDRQARSLELQATHTQIHSISTQLSSASSQLQDQVEKNQEKLELLKEKISEVEGKNQTGLRQNEAKYEAVIQWITHKVESGLEILRNEILGFVKSRFASVESTVQGVQSSVCDLTSRVVKIETEGVRGGDLVTGSQFTWAEIKRLEENFSAQGRLLEEKMTAIIIAEKIRQEKTLQLNIQEMATAVNGLRQKNYEMEERLGNLEKKTSERLEEISRNNSVRSEKLQNSLGMQIREIFQIMDGQVDKKNIAGGATAFGN